MSQHNTMTRASSLETYERARGKSASIDRSDRARLVVSGADRATYLQGLLTNDIAALKAGSGCYAAYLTPQGRMITDLYLYEIGDVMLATMAAGVKDAVVAKFEQFIFSEDVRLGDVTDAFAQIAVVGPEAAAVVAQVLGNVNAASLMALAEHGNLRGAFEGEPAIVTRVTDTGEAGFDVFVERAQRERLIAALEAAGAPMLEAAVADALRIEAGVPQFHRDMDEETIPLEAGIESRAISFSKGCYVGQEVIIRVMHRGHGRVARRLVGLVLDGTDVPADATMLTADGRDAGHVTSATFSPSLGKPIALAYLQRDHAEPGTVVFAGDTRAVVAAVPFKPSPAVPS